MTMQKKLVTALAAMALSVGAQADVNVIDLFNTPQTSLTDNTDDGSALFSQVFSGGGDILGGYRDLGVELLDNTFNTQGVATIGVNSGFLSFSTSSLTTGTGMIRWDGSSAATSFGVPSFGLGASFNPIGTSFELKTIFSDLGYRFDLEAYTDATHWSRVTLSAHEVNPAVLPDGVSSYIPLIGFLACGFDDGTIKVTCGSGGAVDWLNLGALQAIIDPLGATMAIDLTINQVTQVPEPGTLALGGLALLGLGALRRRKQA
jgi:hypothetical protein